MSQDRATFQQLAQDRLAEARLLLKRGHASGAYYLAGYAIECALKARIAAGFRSDEIPELRTVQKIYTHDMSVLVGLAGLSKDLEENLDLYRRCPIVKSWSESARYKIWNDDDASAIVGAIDGEDGIFAWLRSRW